MCTQRLATAQSILDAIVAAKAAMNDAEQMMAENSNRGAWEDIRLAVRAKMGL